MAGPGLDVEALLAQTDKPAAKSSNGASAGTAHQSGGSNEHDTNTRHKSRRPRSRSHDRRRERYDRYEPRARSRSPRRDRSPRRHRSPRRDRSPRERASRHSDRRHDDRRDDRRGRRDDDAERREGRTNERALTDEDRDRRTVFVRQLSMNVASKHLEAFFEYAGPVKEATLVRDRISGRSKGVAYVEFRDVEGADKAMQLTGHTLMGMPIIVTLTEAEKNRQTKAEGSSNSSAAPFHRVYIANLHYDVTEADIAKIFKKFGELEIVHLERDPENHNRSKGHGHIQFVDPAGVTDAFDTLINQQIAGRVVRLGLGSERFTTEGTKNLLAKFPQQLAAFRQNARANAGGRGGRAGRHGNQGPSAALDDTDVSNGNLRSFDRDDLMRRLANQPQSPPLLKEEYNYMNPRPAGPLNQPPSRCVVFKNAFDFTRETGDEWPDELKMDIHDKCFEECGPIKHIAVEEMSPDGCVYIKFETEYAGKEAYQGFNGRWFGGRRLTVAFVPEAAYNGMYPRSV